MDLEHADNSGPAEIRKPSRIPPPGTETGGEVDEALSMFWYHNLLRYDYQKERLTHNSDWGIHVNADALVEWTAGIATAMERDGLPNTPDLALDLAFIFGFDHCFFHHCVDAQVSLHMLRKQATGEDISALRENYDVACERLHIAKQYPQWWLAAEEALANAHVARDPTRLGGLREAFIRYGMLPQPNDATRGPWSLWEQVSMDDEAFAAVSHMVWLQHLTGDMDPLGLLSSLESDIVTDGVDVAMSNFIRRISDEINSTDEVIKDGNGFFRLHSFGGFTQGIFRRLEIPIWFHGGHGPELEKRYDVANGDWPYGTIERLYSHFRTSEIGDYSDDPFEYDDDDFELSP